MRENSSRGASFIKPTMDKKSFRVFAGKTTEIVIVSVMNTIMRLLIKA